jgi:glutamyl-tRNA synthetase
VAKLTHINGDYIRALSLDAFIDRCQPWLAGDRAPWPLASFDEGVFRRIAPLVQERVTVLGEVPAMVDFFFLEEPTMDGPAWEGVTADETSAEILARAQDTYRDCDWTAESLYAGTLALAEAVGRKLGKAQAPIRVALTGRRVGPPLFESMEILGRPAVLARLASAAGRLRAGTPS